MRNECVSAISGGSRSQVDLQNAESAKVDDDVSVVRPSQYPVLQVSLLAGGAQVSASVVFGPVTAPGGSERLQRRRQV